MHRPRVRGRKPARALFVLALACWLALSTAARADAGGAGLSVQPGVTCLQRDELERQLRYWLRAEPLDDRYEVVVEGSALDPRTARLYVRLHGRTVAQRAFEPGPARCSELHAAVALALALALKASVREQRGKEPPAAEGERAPGWRVSAAGLSTYRLLPELAPGVAVAVRRELGESLALRLGAFGVAAYGAELEQQGRAYDASLTALRAEICAGVRVAAAARAGVCGGAWGGALSAAGTGARAVRSVVGWLALAAAAELELELSARWSLELELALAVPLHDVRIGVTAVDGSPVAAQALPGEAWALAVGPAYNF